MQGLVREQWLLRNWRKSSAIKNEPFVANFSFTKNELPEGTTAPEVVEEVVLIDPVTLDQYIVEKIERIDSVSEHDEYRGSPLTSI